MAMSRGERKVADILSMHGIRYQQEYHFPDLLGSKGMPLRFDFAVFDDDGNLDFLIEYQGEQHYVPREFFNGAAALNKQRYYDARKRAYCQLHNIPLVAIPFTDYAILNYDYIMRRAGYGE